MDRDVAFGTLDDLDAAQSPPDLETRSSRMAMLEQIAVALDISLDALERTNGPQEDRTRVLTENVEALQIFAAMTDPDARQQGLAYLR